MPHELNNINYINVHLYKSYSECQSALLYLKQFRGPFFTFNLANF